MDKDVFRDSLKVLRDPLTTPNTVLPNGEKCGEFAHKYVVEQTTIKKTAKKTKPKKK